MDHRLIRNFPQPRWRRPAAPEPETGSANGTHYGKVQKRVLGTFEAYSLPVEKTSEGAEPSESWVDRKASTCDGEAAMPPPPPPADGGVKD